MDQIVEDIQQKHISIIDMFSHGNNWKEEELQMGPMFYIYNRSNNYCLKKCLWYLRIKFLAGITIKNCHLLVVK